MRAILFAVLCVLSFPGKAQEPPSWFAQSLLHLPDDVAEAAREGKRVMLYFGQDGCPYCKRLIEVNWADPRIAAKMRRRFVSLAINIWGDRDVIWTDGREMTEKQLAAMLKVQFTPTLVFLDEKGALARRINGYYPPREFEAAIDNMEVKMGGGASLNTQPFFLEPPLDLRRRRGGKPLAVLFEASPCEGCDELHRVVFRRQEVLAQIAKFDVAQLAVAGREKLVTVEGRRSDASQWAKALQVARAPTLVLFDNSGREIVRAEAYLRAFHVAGLLEYVSSGAYRREPSFQRFLQAKAEAMKHRGEKVDLWN
ncbi:MAG: thioredoxin fold domain-containing protein [Betaproteobacteria bacterium]